MDKIRISNPGQNIKYPYPVCKKTTSSIFRLHLTGSQSANLNPKATDCINMLNFRKMEMTDYSKDSLFHFFLVFNKPPSPLQHPLNGTTLSDYLSKVLTLC